jgi:tRNA dimethylallyltransferase
LTGERKDLYARIDRRVEDMFARGWIDEVKTILSKGYPEDVKPFSSIGYKEILLYLKDLISHDDMVKRIKQETRHYAKRQLTWFSKEKNVNWHEYPRDLALIKADVAAFLTGWI